MSNLFFCSLFGNAQNIDNFSYFNRSKYLLSRNVWIYGVRLTLFIIGQKRKNTVDKGLNNLARTL